MGLERPFYIFEILYLIDLCHTFTTDPCVHILAIFARESYLAEMGRESSLGPCSDQ